MNKILLIGLACFLTVFGKVSAQDLSKATMDKEKHIVLPKDKPLSTRYVVDITCLGMGAAEAKQFADGYRNNLFELSDLDYTKGTVYLNLNAHYLKTPWTLQEWQNFFDNLYLANNNKSTTKQ